MNYGETLVYWYLRLNGFFPLTNFVLHKSDGIEYTSDCDILAVRPPFVYEEIGGKSGDWDTWLSTHIKSGKTLGVICEVKTGDYDPKKLFRPECVAYSVKRLGMTDDENEITRIVSGGSVVAVNKTYTIIKLLVANHRANGNFIYCGMKDVIQFLLDRIEKYPAEKYRDRMFFNSILFQGLIEIKKMRGALRI